MRQANAPRGAHHQLDAQALFQRVDAPANDGSGYALGLRCCGKATLSSYRGEGFDLFKFIHGMCDVILRLITSS